ncbi:hypothetical protein IQ276_017345 [Desmonostoc muscorum LEGE 12446]|uniref:Uncharacterized protein n=1 Tax=Desmonostoc muscorum LEGE 12446 TaxID=1828758 RepID=A0A8J7DHL2_DESMC|nr:hypothetical protein [Desmonostoc muscorum]MCF2148158.1 hypothetical protein [Desmonostoc muscorum LEGE 12446]
MVNQTLPWQENLEQCRLKVNELIQKYRQWDRVCSQVCEIKDLLVRGRNLLGNRSISEADITKVSGSKELDPVESLIKLKRLAQNSIDEIEKPLGVWGWIIEWVLAIALKQKSLDSIAQKLRPYSRRYTAAIRLEAIRREAQAIRQRVQPVDKELAISQITAEVVEGIVTSARTWLNQLQVQTEQEQKVLEKQLNEQIKLVANAEKQISANQEQVGTFCSEADFKFKKAIALLQELLSFPYLPDELRLLVQQYLDNSSNILTETAEFIAQVQNWENRTKQLDTLIGLVDPFATLSTANNLLVAYIFSLHKTTEIYKIQLTETQTKIEKIMVLQYLLCQIIS